MRMFLGALGALALLAACEAATSSDDDGGVEPRPDASVDGTSSDTGSPIVDAGLPDVWANPLTTACDANSTTCGDYFTVGSQSVITFCFQEHCAFECSGYPGNGICAYLDASCFPQPPSVFGICALTPAPPAGDP